MKEAVIGIIGGSGLYDMEGLTEVEHTPIDTPFGPPSDSYRLGRLAGRPVAFLARHGSHHTLLPSEIPHRANIWGFKKLGVRWLLSASAVGSLKEELEPGHFVFPNQFFDRTKNSREHTFFGEGIAAHVSFGEPICSDLHAVLLGAAEAEGARCHRGGTYVNMEGPAFSTLSESNFYRSLGFDVIGMTSLAEAKLAREAEISYANMAMVTDYDCWRGSHEEVNVDDLVAVLQANARLAQRVLARAAAHIPLGQVSKAHHALRSAFLTPREHWPEGRIRDLEPLLRSHLIAR